MNFLTPLREIKHDDDYTTYEGYWGLDRFWVEIDAQLKVHAMTTILLDKHFSILDINGRKYLVRE